MSQDAAERLLAKLRGFVAGLDADERAMFAALVAPAVARIWAAEGRAGASHEVEAYGMQEWTPEALPDALRDAVRGRGLRVEGLGPDQTVAIGEDE